MNMSPEAVKAREEYLESIGRFKRSAPLSFKECEDALRLHSGHLANAAAYLGVSSHTLRLKVNKTPKLIELIDSMKEEVVDHAENQLFKLVLDGNITAIIFTLKTLGRKRGYVERATLEHEIGPETMKNSAKLIEAMRKGVVKVLEEKAIEVKDYEWLESIEPTPLLESPGQSDIDTKSQ